MSRFVTYSVVGLISLFGGLALAQTPEPIQVDIAAQPVGDALNQFAEQSGLQVVLYADDAKGINAAAVAGQFDDATMALDSLLASTGLEYSFINDRTVAVASVQKVAKEGGDSDPGNGRTAGATPRSMMMAQAASEQSQTSRRTATDSDKNERKRPLEEIIVTGTNIRGAAPVGSPLITLDRAEIDRSGFGTVQQLLEVLPQNFGGDAAEDVLSTDDGRSSLNAGASINLRGLGSSSTLVLVNGRRLVQGGGQLGNFTDVSNLPVSALERVEILTDGASAIYGTDAVAGVVNFILRDDYDGVDAKLRYGAVTEGGLDEYQASLTFGKVWNGGNALVSYEYFDRGNLDQGERAFSASADLRPFGGDDFRINASNPGTIVSPILAAIPSGQDGTGLTSGDLLVGQENLQNQNEGFDLLPARERHSVLLMAKQEVHDSIELFGEFRFARSEVLRPKGATQAFFLQVTDAHPNFVSPDPDSGVVFINYNFIDDHGPSLNAGKVTGYNGVLGSTFDLGKTWQGEIYGAYTREESTRSTEVNDPTRVAEALGTSDNDPFFDPAVDGFLNVFGDGSNTPQNVLDYIRGGLDFFLTAELWTVRAKADGELFDAPGGAVRLAVGGEFRRETIDSDSLFQDNGVLVPLQGNAFTKNRNISTVFGELLIPLIGESNGRPGFERLEISASGRFEDYDDFGSTTNPKIGAAWSPIDGFLVRGSWGTSFKAPSLALGAPERGSFFALDVPDPAALDGTTFSLALFGSSPELGPETSTSWTVGAEISPPKIPGLDIQATYFSTAFEDRIGVYGSVFEFFFDTELFAPAITRNPDPAVVQGFLDSPSFRADPPDASQIEAILDARFVNISKTDVRGIDLNLAYRTDTEIGSLSFALNGNYILEFEETLAPGAPVLDVVDTLFSPVDLRLRGSASWSRNGYSASVFVNYTDSYTDDLNDRKIESWATLDLMLAYNTGDRLGWLRNTGFSLNAQNILDSDPPFVNVNGGFDRANANLLGRFLAFTVAKEW